MEESEDSQLEGNVPLQKNEENFSLEEWTIIEEDDNAKKALKERTKISSPESESSENENTSDAEEAHELTKPNSEQPATTNAEKEESDGVSVISESENEERTDEAVGRITLYRSVSQGTEELELQNSNKEVTWCVCLLVACSVLTAIGISLGSYARDSLPRDTEYFSLKMENDRLLERMKEFTDVKSLLEEIKSGLIVERSPGEVEPPGEEEEAKSFNRVLKEGEKMSGKGRTTGEEKFLSERLQIFLHTICLMLDDIGQPQEMPVSRKSLCETRTFFSDLTNLRNWLDRAIGEMDETTGLTNRRFLEDIDFRIASMRDSLVIDLGRALDRLSLKNEKKVDKVVGKMREKLCVLRNTMPSDNKVRQSLEANNDLLENCDQFGGRRKDRRSSEIGTEQPPPSRPASQKANSKCPRPHDLRPNPDEKNPEKLYNGSNDNRRKDWRGKKQSGENSPDSKATTRKNEDDTCSDPSTARVRRSATWKWSKQQKSSHPPLLVKEQVKPRDDSHEKENPARRYQPSHRTEENIDGALSAKKNWKANTGRDEAKKRKLSSSTEDLENDNAKGNIKQRTTKVRSRLSNVNDGLEIGMEATVRHRAKKRFDEGEKKRLNGNKEGEDVGTNGQWQFARSQTRNELRKAESQENWYFDRMRNRRSSRTNIDGFEERR